MENKRRHSIAIAFLVATVLTGCGPSAEQRAKAEADRVAAIAKAAEAKAAADEEARLMKSAQDRIRSILRDPESARFRKFSMAEGVLSDGSGRKNRVACGYVNAKNGFGGYTGDQPWWAFVMWEGSRAACINKIDDCGVVGLAAREEADMCRKTLGD